MVVRGEEGQRGAKRGAHVAVVRGRDKHRGQGTAGERLAPSPRGQERRARHRAVLLVVLRDVVARQLGRRRRRDRDRSPEVEREGRREGCDAEHGAGVTGPRERGDGGAGHGGGRAVLTHRGEQRPAHERNRRHDDGIACDREAPNPAQGAVAHEHGREQHDEPERDGGGRDGGLLGRGEVERRREPAREGDEPHSGDERDHRVRPRRGADAARDDAARRAEGERRHERQHVLRQLRLVEREKQQRDDHPRGEEQRLPRRRLAPSTPQVACAPHAREGRHDPRERGDRQDRQIVPERRRPMKARRGHPLQSLAHEDVGRELRVAERDREEPRQRDEREHGEPAPGEQASHRGAGRERVGHDGEEDERQGDRSLGERGGAERGPRGDRPALEEEEDGGRRAQSERAIEDRRARVGERQHHGGVGEPREPACVLAPAPTREPHE